MTGLAVCESTSLDDGYLAPRCDVHGQTRSAFFHPDGYSLWQLSAELEVGAEIAWDAHHGDEAVFVVAGELAFEDRRCGPDAVIVVEAGVPAVVRAVADSRVLHFGPACEESPSDGPLGSPESEGRGVHTIVLVEAQTVLPEPFPVGPYYYTDGTCPTCRITFFSVDGRGLDEPHRVGSHVHSHDEIVHVLEGELRIGQVSAREGMSVAIPANHRYGFRTPGPFRFLNYRADVSTITRTPGSEPIVETVQSIRAFVGAQ